MGDLAKYLAEVVEFVVAGVLVFFSLLLLGYVVVRPDVGALPDELPFLTSLGGLLPLVGVALIYALGILAEGMSRILFEHGLGELTAEKLEQQASEEQKADLKEMLQRIDVADLTPVQAARRLHKEEVAHYEGVREEWRMFVLAHSPSLNAQVEGQLKRLRIERAAALSGAISSVALLVDVALAAAREGFWARAVILVGLVVVSAVTARLWLVRKQVPEIEDASAAAELTREALTSEPRAVPEGESQAEPVTPDVSDDPGVRERLRGVRARWSDQDLQQDAARAATLGGSLLAAALLLDLVVETGTGAMGLRAAMLVATIAITACAVALSVVRLKRYLNSIIRCHRALAGSTPAGPGLSVAEARAS